MLLLTNTLSVVVTYKYTLCSFQWWYTVAGWRRCMVNFWPYLQ